MVRGRKKGGLKINNITNKQELINMIINQANSLNKKIKAFKVEGIEEHQEYIQNLLTHDMVKFNASGSISKSKKFYEDKHTIWLKKTLSALHKINNHEFYGTTKKYKKEVTKSLKGVQDYSKGYLKNKGYDDKFINDIVNDKGFFAKLYGAFNEGINGYGSDQIIDKVALTYGEDTGFTSEEMDKVLSNIEYSKNVLDRLQQEQNDFDEWKRNKKMR